MNAARTLVLVATLAAITVRGMAQDCNGDGIPDATQIGPFTARSMVFGTGGADAAVAAGFVVDPATASPVMLASSTIQFWQKGALANGSSALVAMPDVLTNRLNVHTPWTDGKIYFDFGAAREVCTAPGLTQGWHHWAFVADSAATPGNQMRIYLDGVLLAAVQDGTFPLRLFGNGFLPDALHVGSRFVNGFQGAISEVRVEPVARTTAQIVAGMLAPPAGAPPIRYSFEGPAGIIDNAGSSGAAANLVVSGTDVRRLVYEATAGGLQVCSNINATANLNPETLAKAGDQITFSFYSTPTPGDGVHYSIARPGQAVFNGVDQSGQYSYSFTVASTDVGADVTVTYAYAARLTFEPSPVFSPLGPAAVITTHVRDAFLSAVILVNDLVVTQTTRHPGQYRFTAFSLDPQNWTSAGAWFGLHVTSDDLLGQWNLQSAPFIGALGSTGYETTVVAGIGPAIANLDAWAVTVVFDASPALLASSRRVKLSVD